MALWRDKIRLGTRAGDDSPYQEGGNPIAWGDSIFANQIPAHSNEFHAAMASGVDVQHVFEVNPAEYQGETHAQYNGQAYSIYRTYLKNDRVAEIYLTSKEVA